MKLALDDLHAKKLRDGKQHVERLVRQWQQTIQQIKEQEQRVGCHLLPKNVAIENTFEMARRTPAANYLQVVEIRDRVAHELSATVHHAQSNLQQEITSWETAQNNAKSTIAATRTEHEAALARAKSQCDTNATLTGAGGCLVEILSGVASWVGVVAAFSAAFDVAPFSTMDVSAWNLLCGFVGVPVGIAIAVTILIPGLERSSAESAFNRKKSSLSREFDMRVSKLVDLAAESTDRLNAAQAAADVVRSCPRNLDVVSARDGEVNHEQTVKTFDDLTPINPFQKIKLETGPTSISMRVMDLLTPIGKGQRALLVSPPRSGKTTLLQEIADAVSKNYPDIYLIVLLIDERPEEVTEMRRRVNGEVFASLLDCEVENHVRVSQLVFEKAKRMAEAGRDVFLLLDSITSTARAFNKWTNTDHAGTGGLDVKAMDLPKKMFGMASQFEEGGSLTVVGTVLIETGDRMADAIFQEFKGTGNMEIVLSRELAEHRTWPAIDIGKSGTRRDEKFFTPEELEGVTALRRSLVSLSPIEAMEMLTKTLAKYPTNAEFLAKIRSVL